MKLRPVNDCLLAEPLNGEPAENNLLFLDKPQQKLQAMRVIHTPDFVRDNEEIFLKGDKVVPSPGSGIRLMLDGKEVMLLRQKDILAVLE